MCLNIIKKNGLQCVCPEILHAFSHTYITNVACESEMQQNKKLKTYLFETASPLYIFDGSVLQWRLLPVSVYDYRYAKQFCLLHLSHSLLCCLHQSDNLLFINYLHTDIHYKS